MDLLELEVEAEAEEAGSLRCDLEEVAHPRKPDFGEGTPKPGSEKH